MQTKVKIERVGIGIDWTDVLRRSSYANNPNAQTLLMQFLATSEAAYVAKYDGEIVCVWGLIPPTLLSKAAYLWLLPTDLIREHQFLFIRHSQLIVESILNRYPTIVGTTEALNKSAIRWIRWLGGEYADFEQHGMRPFVIRKKS